MLYGNGLSLATYRSIRSLLKTDPYLVLLCGSVENCQLKGNHYKSFKKEELQCRNWVLPDQKSKGQGDGYHGRLRAVQAAVPKLELL